VSRLIAVVDDETDIRELVELHLGKAGFRARGFADGREFGRFLARETPDLVVLDLMLPDTDGLDICKNLKSDPKTAAVPVVMLTARGEEFDKVLGLELGADDYITKPFSPKELVARVKAVLRRNEQRETSQTIELPDGLVLDLNRYEATIAGKRIGLTTTEFRVLRMLAERRGWVLSRDEILDQLWGNEKSVIDRTVDVHITNLRRKLGKAGRLLLNVRGVGYKLDA
jgi:two-component system phosphate regulon response regulator PhoB/two-component system alkaline phosphatase synthesis response regulator PhoP